MLFLCLKLESGVSRMATTKTAGRPPKYKSKEEMQQKIDKYFQDCEGTVLKNDDGSIFKDKNGNPVIIGAKPLTMTGLALALGFSSRQSLLNYKAKKEFMDTITRARARVEQFAEECLFDKNTANGAKFSLANNFEGWKEKQDIDITEHQKLEELL